MSADPDPFRLHRAALGPLLPGATAAALADAAGTVLAAGELLFTRFLVEQGLAPLWHRWLERAPHDMPVSPVMRRDLRDACRRATALYLLQRQRLLEVRELMEGAGLEHVVMKGAHTREVYFDDPALRPAQDIDLLVRPADRVAAINALRRGGYAFRPEHSTISHETRMVKHTATVDLHWDILRPGRTRQPMTEPLLAARRDYGTHWGCDAVGSLFLMLVHPVFTKYSSAPQARLCRLLDLALLLDREMFDEDGLRRLLSVSGLQTAAWITLHLLRLLSGDASAGRLEAALQPSPARQRYLAAWLAANRDARFERWPLLIQLGFTLPAHDSPRDALHALGAIVRGRWQGRAQLRQLQHAVQAS